MYHLIITTTKKENGTPTIKVNIESISKGECVAISGINGSNNILIILGQIESRERDNYRSDDHR